MRFLLPGPVAVAAVCFVVGYAGARWGGNGKVESMSAYSDLAASPGSPSTAGTNTSSAASPATSEARTKALLAAYSQPVSLARDHALMEALLAFGPADFVASAPTILECLGELPSMDSRNLGDAWMDRWLELDSAGALRFLSESSFLTKLSVATTLGGDPSVEYSRAQSAGVFDALARRQPEWTRDSLVAMKSEAQRKLGIYALLREAGSRGADFARTFLATFAEGANRPAAIAGYAEGLARVDVHSAVGVALAEPVGPLREAILACVFRRAGHVGLSGIGELLDRIEDPAQRLSCASMSLAWSQPANGEVALEFIKAETSRVAAGGGAHSEMQSWAAAVSSAGRGTHARLFAEWAESAPAGGREIFGRVVSDWAALKPDAFLGWLQGRGATMSAETAALLSEPLETLVQRDPAQIREWVESLASGPLRDQAQYQLALREGREGNVQQAAAAYRPVASLDRDGRLAKQLAIAFAQQNAAEGAKWAMEQPAGSARKLALEVIAEEWSKNDPAGAAQWLTQMPPGAERDDAVRRFAGTAAVADPETAAEWVLRIEDRQKRTSAARTVYFMWKLENPVAARAWLRSVPEFGAAELAQHLRTVR